MFVLSAGCSERAPAKSAAAAGTPSCSRVIALAPNAAEIICGLEACDLLVGVSSFCKFPPQLDGVPKIGGLRDPDLEVILTLKPDLVILRGQTGPTRRLCLDRGIPVYDDKVESLHDLYTTITDLGRLVGRQTEAVAMIDLIKSELQAVARRVAGLGRPKVLFTLRSPQTLSNVFTTGNRTFISELIEIAGGRNIFADSEVLYPAASLEEIVARNPDVIIEAMTSDQLGDQQRRQLLDQWRKLGPVTAVRTGRVHFVTDGHFTIPSQRVTLTARTLMSIIHPEAAAGD